MPANSLLKRALKEIKRHRGLYLMLVLPVAAVIIFSYIPMFGILISFQDYSLRKGIFGSRFIGLKNFKRFFESPMFFTITPQTP